MQRCPGLSVIIPASNEAASIGLLLQSLLASEQHDGAGAQLGAVEIIIVANGCQDDTAAVAQSFAAKASGRGWSLIVRTIDKGNKLNALNIADELAAHGNRIYVDADVQVSPDLLPAIAQALDSPEARYVTGRLVIAEAQSPVTHLYARFWSKLPFVTAGSAGCGLFAVNAAGRRLWGRYPDIIADDTFVRLQFAPRSRHEVRAPYVWPMVEGFSNLVKVRRRQDRGVRQIAQLYPALARNDDKPQLSARQVLRLVLSDPLGFLIYATVAGAVRLPTFGRSTSWERGR